MENVTLMTWKWFSMLHCYHLNW